MSNEDKLGTMKNLHEIEGLLDEIERLHRHIKYLYSQNIKTRGTFENKEMYDALANLKSDDVVQIRVIQEVS